jgi:hypothetical protein
MRFARRLPAALLALALVPGAASRASATLILALDLPAMVGRADRIAVVDVVSVSASWNDRHDRISTAVELTVVDCWKGALPAGAHLTVRQPGGTVGDITTTVDGMPRFSPGERALVFLRGPTDRASVVGLTQGKRPMHRDPASGRWMVTGPDRAGADFVRPRTDAAAGAPVIEARARPLDAVRADIRALAPAQ